MRRRSAIGLVAQAGGVLVLAAGMQVTSLGLFLAGGVIAGAGSGLLFKAAVGTVAAAAAPAVRGEALAGLFLIGYLGLVGPVLGLGVATRFVAATTAVLWFSGLLLILLFLVAVLARKDVTRPAISQVESSRIAETTSWNSQSRNAAPGQKARGSSE
jgi:MFS family permease